MYSAKVLPQTYCHSTTDTKYRMFFTFQIRHGFFQILYSATKIIQNEHINGVKGKGKLTLTNYLLCAQDFLPINVVSIILILKSIM